MFFFYFWQRADFVINTRVVAEVFPYTETETTNVFLRSKRREKKLYTLWEAKKRNIILVDNIAF